jgi:hypothetical protein
MQMASAHLTILEKHNLIKKEKVNVGYDSENRRVRYLTQWEVCFVMREQINELEVGKKPRVRRSRKRKTDTNELIGDMMHLIDEVVHNSDAFPGSYPKTAFFNSWRIRAKLMGARCREYERSRFAKSMEATNLN